MREDAIGIDGVLSDDHDLIPSVKWLVAFRNRNPDGHIGKNFNKGISMWWFLRGLR